MVLLALMCPLAAALNSHIRVSDSFAEISAEAFVRDVPEDDQAHIISPMELDKDTLILKSDYESQCRDQAFLQSLPKVALPQIETQEQRFPDGTCSWSTTSGQCSLGFTRVADLTAQPAVAENPHFRDNTECFVSHKFRFIFVHVPKNAGTSTTLWLQKAICLEEQDCDPCFLELMVCQASFEQFPAYSRFAWVRHPYDRAVSIWSMATSPGIAAPGVTDEVVPFREFWLQYADNWLHEPYDHNITNLPEVHGLPQALFLTNAKGCLNVDFLGSMDNSTDEFRRFLQVIDAQELVAILDKVGFENEDGVNDYGAQKQDDEGQSAREMVDADPELRAHLDQYFAADFSLLGSCKSA